MIAELFTITSKLKQIHLNFLHGLIEGGLQSRHLVGMILRQEAIKLLEESRQIHNNGIVAKMTGQLSHQQIGMIRLHQKEQLINKENKNCL